MPDAQRYPHALILPRDVAVAIADRVLNRLGGGPPNVDLVTHPSWPDEVMCLLGNDVPPLLTSHERSLLRSSDDGLVRQRLVPSAA